MFVNGGTAKAVPGTWSATSELLATELAPRFPELAFAEVRYRLKSWHALDSCMEDARAALERPRAPIAPRRLLDGRCRLDRRRSAAGGRRGARPRALDPRPAPARRPSREAARRAPRRVGPLAPRHSRASARRARGRASSARVALGVEGSYRLIPRGLHGAAVRRRSGALVRLPRAEAWVDGVGERLERFRLGREA